MTTGDKGLDLIKRFEGCCLTAYKLAGEHYYTIGYGHSFDSSIKAGTTWTQAQAEAQLKKDLAKFEGYVTVDVPHDLNQNQFDALVSYCYNRGRGGLRQLVGACSCLEDYPDNIVKYWGSAERYKTGLVNRRKAERELFLTPCDDTTAKTAGDYIKLTQQYINSVTDAGIAVDGIFGPKTLTASIMALQTLLNRLYNASLKVDGILGPKTLAALPALRKGAYGVLVHLLQGLLYCRGYDPKGLDYAFGAGTLAAVQAFQKDAGIAVDGVAGPVTWRGLLTA